MQALLDLETLGTSAPCAIVQIGCVIFDEDTGRECAAFFARVNPWLPPALPVDLSTLHWADQAGTFSLAGNQPPPGSPPAVALPQALADFTFFITNHLDRLTAIWSWGSAFDFPILRASFAACARPLPWCRQYWLEQCARTVWRMAFGDRKHDQRPHHALEDCRHAVADLQSARSHLAARSLATVALPVDSIPAAVRTVTEARAWLAVRANPGTLAPVIASSHGLDLPAVNHALRRLHSAGLVIRTARSLDRPGRPYHYAIPQAA